MLIVTNVRLSDAQVQEIEAIAPGLEVARVPDDRLESYAPYLDRMEIGFCQLRFTREVVDAAGALRWVHSTGAGVNNLGPTGLLDGRFVFTSSNGVHRRQMAEHILSMMLMHARQLSTFLDAQRERRWLDQRERPAIREIGVKTLGIIGLGNIGDEAAQRAHDFGVRVIGTRRTVTDTDRANRPPYVDELLPLSRLGELLAASDYLLLALPLTPETRGMIGEGELQALKPGAFLINIARGAIIDETALIRALESGRLGGAALDVFEPEPLPADSPLWGFPNVVITPHISGGSADAGHRYVDFFKENLKRFVAGEPLLNVYDPARGY